MRVRVRVCVPVCLRVSVSGVEDPENRHLLVFAEENQQNTKWM